MVKFKATAVIVTAILTLFGRPAWCQMSQSDLAGMRARGEEEGWTFTVDQSEATQYPIEDLCGLVVPKDWRAKARFVSFKRKADLPAQFDLRPYLPPVKSQGGCGSCWAFATVGVLECVVSLKEGTTVDLSEQWLVSCNTETEAPHLLLNGEWGCNGGWFAHGYHQASPGGSVDECGESGAVLETDFPYVRDDAACGCPYEHYYWIDSWAYISGEEDIPDVDSIKQAIMMYGPISAAVCATGNGFQAYSGGVFNGAKPEDREVDHAIILVGWDDTLGTAGAWILRNSWGTSWGIDGYMYIEYGCSDVGLGACYVEYPGTFQISGPTITQQPASVSAAVGDPCTFHIEAAGLGTLQYQWTKDGQTVGSNADTYTIESAELADCGTYVCHVSDLQGTTSSNEATLQLMVAEGTPTAGTTTLIILAAACALIGAAMRRSGKRNKDQRRR